MIVGCFTGKCCFLYNRGELDVGVVERSTHTNGMHELCDDPAVCSRTTMNAPYGLLCATWLLPRRAGVAPCEVWLLEEGRRVRVTSWERKTNQVLGASVSGLC